MPALGYDCNTDAYQNRFDIAYFPGVLYHLSDPVLALRILYNALKPEGGFLVGSAGIDTPEPLCRFDGSLTHFSGSKERLNRGGWNWFIPSAFATERMLCEAGFEDVDTRRRSLGKRVYTFGRKRAQVEICKAGLSVRTIR